MAEEIGATHTPARDPKDHQLLIDGEPITLEDALVQLFERVGALEGSKETYGEAAVGNGAEADIARLAAKVADHENTIDAANTIARLRKERDNLRAELVERTSERTELMNELGTVKDERDRLRDDVAVERNLKNAARTDRDDALRKLANANAALAREEPPYPFGASDSTDAPSREDLLGEIGRANGRVDGLERELAHNKSLVRKFEADAYDYKKRYEHASHERDDLKAECDRQSQTIYAAMRSLDAVRAEAKRLRERQEKIAALSVEPLIQ